MLFFLGRKRWSYNYSYPWFMAPFYRQTISPGKHINVSSSKSSFFAAPVFNCLYVNTACVIQNPLSLFLLRDRFRKIISAKNLTDFFLQMIRVRHSIKCGDHWWANIWTAKTGFVSSWWWDIIGWKWDWNIRCQNACRYKGKSIKSPFKLRNYFLAFVCNFRYKIYKISGFKLLVMVQFIYQQVYQSLI